MKKPQRKTDEARGQWENESRRKVLSWSMISFTLSKSLKSEQFILQEPRIACKGYPSASLWIPAGFYAFPWRALANKDARDSLRDEEYWQQTLGGFKWWTKAAEWSMAMQARQSQAKVLGKGWNINLGWNDGFFWKVHEPLVWPFCSLDVPQHFSSCCPLPRFSPLFIRNKKAHCRVNETYNPMSQLEFWTRGPLHECLISHQLSWLGFMKCKSFVNQLEEVTQVMCVLQTSIVWETPRTTHDDQNEHVLLQIMMQSHHLMKVES